LKPLPFVEAIAFAKTQAVVLPDAYYGERIGLARAQARTISSLAGVDQIQAVFDVLDKHLANGGTFKSFRNDIASNKIAVGLPKHRLELVFRNNIQTAYNAGRWQQFQQSKTSHPYLRYSAVNDGRTRPSHRAMHGHIARVDDVWWKTHMPQNGFRCRCTAIALTEKQAKRYGIPSKPPANAQPDKGWDYNAGQAPMAGLKQSAEHKKTTVDKKLVKAVDKAIESTQQFRFAKTSMEAARIGRELNLADNVNWTGVHVDVANEFNKSMYDTLKLFPELRKQQQFLGSAQAANRLYIESNLEYTVNRIVEVNRGRFKADDPRIIKAAKSMLRKTIGKLSGKTYAHSRSGNSGVDGIAINQSWGKDPMLLNKSLIRDAETGWHPKGTESVRSIADHELGHEIDALLKLRSNDKVKSLFNEWRRRDPQGLELSRYAINGHDPIAEFIAEAWAEYMAGEPRKWSVKMVEIIHIEYVRFKNER